MRSTTRARLALCRAARDWPDCALSRSWCRWCDSRSFRVTGPLRG